jgi:hypothetical protein
MGVVMPERFESNVYTPEVTKMMKDAFSAAWPKVSQVGKDAALTRQLLASAIIDEVDAGSCNQDEIVEAALGVLASAGIARKVVSLRR